MIFGRFFDIEIILFYCNNIVYLYLVEFFFDILYIY